VFQIVPQRRARAFQTRSKLLIAQVLGRGAPLSPDDWSGEQAGGERLQNTTPGPEPQSIRHIVNEILEIGRSGCRRVGRRADFAATNFRALHNNRLLGHHRVAVKKPMKGEYQPLSRRGYVDLAN